MLCLIAICEASCEQATGSTYVPAARWAAGVAHGGRPGHQRRRRGPPDHDGPRRAAALGWPDDSLGGLTLPRGMALDENSTLYMLQLHAPWRILRFDPDRRVFASLEGVGGAGSDARHLRDPRNIAIGGGYLYVADTGNRRVQVFARASLALLHLFELPAWQPVDVTVDGGQAYILDARGGHLLPAPGRGGRTGRTRARGTR